VIERVGHYMPMLDRYSGGLQGREWEDSMTQTARERSADGLPELPLPRVQECLFGPPPEYARLRAEGVTKVACPTGLTAWLVTRYADAREVLGDPERFSTRPGQAAHVMAHLRPDLPVWEGQFPRMDGADHLRFRRHLAPEVSTVRRVNELRPLVQRVVDDRLDTFADVTPPIELYGEFAKPVTTSVIAELLGVPYSERDLFQYASAAVFDAATTTEGLEEALLPLFEYLYGLVCTRRAAPGEDMLSRMIVRSDQTDQPFTDMELVAMAGSLLVAGYDTTASIMSYGYLALLAHSGELIRLREDPALASTAVEELVRYLGAGVGLLRGVTRDTQVGGQPMAAGDYVVVAVQSANRDPELCPDPDRFDVGRKVSAHLGFGYGPHQCVGQQLARLELSTVLETIARRIPSLRLAAPLADIKFREDTVVVAPAALPVTWDVVLPASAGR
jgi:cytochrome P450